MCAFGVHTMRLKVAQDPKKRRQSDEPAVTTGLRRVGRVVHDDRGNARLEFHVERDDGTARFDRPTFTIEGEERISRLALEDYRRSAGSNPYDRVDHAGTAPAQPRKPRKDLRKLSEWIKLKKTLDEQKAQGDTDDE